MKLLVDMNLSPRWCSFLSDAGYPSIHWSTIGDPAAFDFELLTYAKLNRCVVITNDLDFGAILAAVGGNAPSVLQIRSGNTSPETIGQTTIMALQKFASELEFGALVTVDVERARVRLLPLRGT